MTEKRVLLVLIFINTLLACGYFLWGICLVPRLWKRKPADEKETYSRVGYLIRAAVMLLCPVVGPLLFLLGQVFNRAFFRQDVDLADIIFSKERVEKREKADAMREGNMVPMEEALAISDTESLRTLMLEVIRKDTKKSLTSIAQALNSEDSETSHYAASVLGDELNDFRQRVQEIYKKMKKKEEDAFAYAVLLLEYMNELLSQRVFPEMEQKTYVEMMEEACRFLYEHKPSELAPEYVEWICLRLLETGDYEKMGFWCSISREEFPEELSTYTCQLKLYFNQGDRKRFFEVLRRLKKSDVVIDRETLDLIRIFS